MSDYILHYGVPGMKWGVRRTFSRNTYVKGVKTHSKGDPADRSGFGVKTTLVRKKLNTSDDAKEAARISKKHVSEMSNAELRKLNDRINLEQQYSRLNPSVIKKGAKVVATAAIVTNTLVNLYDKSDRLISIGQKLVGKFSK